MDYAEKILGISDELEKRVSELTGAVSGPLLLGASTTVAELILPQILGEFKARYPQVQANYLALLPHLPPAIPFRASART